MKIRTIASPVMVDTINALGASATPMGFGDLYLGLKSGVVDGAENAPDAIWYAKHYEVAKYFTITNHFRTPVVVVMNKAKFDALPPEYKEIIMTAHFVYVLKGWIEFRFDGIVDSITVSAGSCLSQPAGVAHNVIAQSDDLELIEINMPWSVCELQWTGGHSSEWFRLLPMRLR